MERKNKVGPYILFIISPVLGFIHSVANIRKKQSLWVIGAFICFFAYCNTYNFNRLIDEDGCRHASFYKYSSIADYIANIKTALFFDDIQTYDWFSDSYINILALLSKSVNGSYHFFFLLAGIFYSIFFLLSVKKILFHFQIENRLFISCLFVWLFVNYSIYGLTAIRFASAVWFSVWCTLKLYLDKDKKFLLIILLSSQIHIAFWFYCVVLYIGYFFGKYERFWAICAISTFFVSSASFTLLQSFTDFLPPIFQAKILAYGEDRALMVAEDMASSNFRQYFDLLYKITTGIIVLLLYKNRGKMKQYEYYTIFQLFLVVYSFVNLLSFIPDMGRFSALSMTLLITSISMINITRKIKILVYVVIFSLLLTIYICLMGCIPVVPGNFWYSNVFSILNNI